MNLSMQNHDRTPSFGFAKRAGASFFAGLLGLCLTGLTATAQEQEDEDKPRIQIPKVGQEGDPGQELQELFAKVELRLREIDDLLYDASSPSGARSGALENLKEAGIGELIKASTDAANQNIEDINRIIEIAQQNGGSCPKPGQGKDGQSPGSGKPGENAPKQTSSEEGGAKEQTPERPGGNKPQGEQQGQKPGEKEKEGEGQEPNSPKASDDKNPENREGGTPPQDAKANGLATVNSAAQWGNLPIHVREVFRSEGGGDLPPQYRSWIEAYYKRLNKVDR